MSQTIISRRRLRAVVAGVLAVALAAGLNSAVRSGAAPPSRSVPMLQAAYRGAPVRARGAAARARRPSAAIGRRSVAGTGSQLQQVQAIADSSGWNWRAAGVSYVIGFHPQACCHWGIYDSRTGAIYVGPTAFATAERLRYVVLHETAHAWQYRAAPIQALMGDYTRWGYHGANALEAGADCIATLWGADRSQGHYWRCPDAALAVAARERSAS
ncbi:MAG: hypothetical protein QOD57_2583 [Actinomycetota bacterium]|nr:hypothetical protein [Actinomycetota bacterium]